MTSTSSQNKYCTWKCRRLLYFYGTVPVTLYRCKGVERERVGNVRLQQNKKTKGARSCWTADVATKLNKCVIQSLNFIFWFNSLKDQNLCTLGENVVCMYVTKMPNLLVVAQSITQPKTTFCIGINFRRQRQDDDDRNGSNKYSRSNKYSSSSSRAKNHKNEKTGCAKMITMTLAGVLVVVVVLAAVIMVALA